MSAATTSGSSARRQTNSVQRVHSVALLIAVGAPLLLFAATGRYELSLLDEGFLWYGAQRVRAGELPLLDFQSYDIGRYYWSAFWMWLTQSDGILPVRAGNAVLGSISVAIAVGLVRAGSNRSHWQLIGAAVLVAAWMVPDFKTADSFAALLLVAGLAGWLDRPADWRRALSYGVCLGVASTIGINHALYGTVAFALALSWNWWVRRSVLDGRVFAALACGIVFGYLPVLVCHVGVAGFSAAFADSIQQIFEAGTTNLPLALPRLTAVFEQAGPGYGKALRESFLAAWLILAVMLWANGAARLGRRPDLTGELPSAVFCAALIVCVPYAHYALSRLDVSHLAVGAPPLLIAVFTHPRAGSGSAAARIGLFCMALATFILVPLEHRGFQALRGLPHQTIVLRGERLHVSVDTAAEITWLRGLTETYASDNKTFFAAPYWPGAYAAMRRRSPTWEIYALFPSTSIRQRREIERLSAASVGFAVISRRSVDDRVDLGFSQTHPLIDEYLQNCYARSALTQAAPPGVQTFLATSIDRVASQHPPQAQHPLCKPITQISLPTI